MAEIFASNRINHKATHSPSLRSGSGQAPGTKYLIIHSFVILVTHSLRSGHALWFAHGSQRRF